MDVSAAGYSFLRRARRTAVAQSAAASTTDAAVHSTRRIAAREQTFDKIRSS